MPKSAMLGAAALFLALTVSISANALADSPKPVNVPAGDLTTALELLEKQSGVEIVYRPEMLKGLRTSGVKGTLSSEEAVTKLLKGTKLTLHSDRTGVLLITEAGVEGAASAPGEKEPAAKRQDDATPRESLPVGQVDQGAAGPKIERRDGESKKTSGLEEIVVTGSRIPIAVGERAQEVQVYTKEQIDQSGQNSVADFLNTLPSVSLSSTENQIGGQTFGGATTVQLHGLPLGTTLVLFNGRRVETSGTQASTDVFDLNNIPLAAVERIEVVADGSSAVYGSDAIAGVVNIVLRKSFDGVEAGIKYGGANGIDETDANLALGKQWDRGSVSIVGSYQERGSLHGADRFLTSTNDYSSFGGPDNNLPTCNPGNVFSTSGAPLPGAPAGSNATYAAVSSRTVSGKPTFANFNYGTLNECLYGGDYSVIPSTHRTGIFAQGDFKLTPSTELFSEFMYSKVREQINEGNLGLFGIDGFQSYTVSAANPFNPFGTTVGIADSFNSIQAVLDLDTTFVRALVGARGELWKDWSWELSAWQSSDRTDNTEENFLPNPAIQDALNSSNPSTALNPFVAGSQGSQALLQSLYSNVYSNYHGRDESANGFMRGPIAQLPAGV
jgi:iron complex outermembrane recepter protein